MGFKFSTKMISVTFTKGNILVKGMIWLLVTWKKLSKDWPSLVQKLQTFLTYKS